LQAADLQFDAESHTYRVGGQVWPSVTQILEPLQLLDGIPPHILEAAAKFGTHVHQACHLDNLGVLDWHTLDVALVPYVEAWRKFQADTRAVIVASEIRVANQKHRYCGTLDTLTRIAGVRELTDIKSTAAIPFTVGPQTIAYAQAIDEPRIRRRVVQLRGDGTYRSERLTESTDWHNFLSVLNVHNWRSKHGRNICAA
jgi:hypothetical protein